MPTDRLEFKKVREEGSHLAIGGKSKLDDRCLDRHRSGRASLLVSPRVTYECTQRSVKDAFCEVYDRFGDQDGILLFSQIFHDESVVQLKCHTQFPSHIRSLIEQVPSSDVSLRITAHRCSLMNCTFNIVRRFSS